MNTERESKFISRLVKGCQKHSIRGGLVLGIGLTAEFVSLERMYEGEYNQALGVIIPAFILVTVNLYDFYLEGGREETGNKDEI